jgi:hypothetical protein
MITDSVTPVFDWSESMRNLDWEECALTASERGLMTETITWYRDHCYIGLTLVILNDGARQWCISFPVLDAESNVFRAQCRLPGAADSDGTRWIYYPEDPAERTVPPLVIGNLGTAEEAIFSESQWDLISLSERLGIFDRIEAGSIALVSTRGAANARKLLSLALGHIKSFVVLAQNDEAGQKWLRDVVAVLPHGEVRVVNPPPPHKDLNDWVRAGVSVEELSASIHGSLKPRPGIEVSLDLVDEGKTDAGLVPEVARDSHPFPVHLLYPPLGGFVKAVAAALNIPCALPAVAALGAVAAALGRGLQIQTGTELFCRGNLYLIAAAMSGVGKSLGIKHATAPLWAFQEEQLRLWQQESQPDLLARRGMLESEIKSLQSRCKANERNPEKDSGFDRDEVKQQLIEKYRELTEVNEALRPPQLIVEDTTVEAAGVALRNNREQAFSLSADAGKAVQNLEGRYAKEGSSIEDNLYLKAYSGDPHVVHRITRESILLRAPCMTLLWFTQPDLFQRLIRNERLRLGGFLARCPCCDTRVQPTELPPSLDDDLPIPQKEKEDYHALIGTLARTYLEAKEPLTVPRSNDASKLFRAYHNALVPRRKTDLSDINSIAARWHENAWRVSLGQHATLRRGDAHCYAESLETAERALGIMKWFSEEVVLALQPAREDRKHEDLTRLLSIVIERYGGVATLRDLKGRNGFTETQVQELVEAFPAKIRIERTKSRPKGGAPSRQLRVL